MIFRYDELVRVFKNTWFARFAGKEGMEKQYRDEIAMVCHDAMKGAHRVGAVSDAEMKEFEADCFIEVPKTTNDSEIPVAAMQYNHATT